MHPNIPTVTCFLRATRDQAFKRIISILGKKTQEILIQIDINSTNFLALFANHKLLVKFCL